MAYGWTIRLFKRASKSFPDPFLKQSSCIRTVVALARVAQREYVPLASVSGQAVQNGHACEMMGMHVITNLAYLTSSRNTKWSSHTDSPTCPRRLSLTNTH